MIIADYLGMNSPASTDTNIHWFIEQREDWLSLELGNKTIKYQFCNEDYLELSWIGSITANFHRGWLRRVIKPSITPSELLFNLINDAEYFFDNSDGVLDVDTLVTKVRQCFSQDTEGFIKEYPSIYNETKEKCRRKRFISLCVYGIMM